MTKSSKLEVSEHKVSESKSDEPSGPLLYPNEPARFIAKDIEPFLIWCVKNDASDVTIQTNEQVIASIHGKICRVTTHRTSPNEVMEWVIAMYESESAKSKLAGENGYLDFAYEVKPNRVDRYRFRVNVTSISVEGHNGIQITARTIPSTPPSLEGMRVHQEILDNLSPKQGMIIITGATGSGKSTLLAGIIRHLCEEKEGHRKILTYEAPIEFVYDNVEKPTTSIAQTEVHRHIQSFSEGTRNALRRKPDIILVGEARDAETIGETITASMTGHLVYSTVHSNGFADTIRRMVNVFTDDKASRALDIISSLRMVVSQRLVQSTDGKRIALREWVVFNDEIVNYLLAEGVDNLPSSCRYVLKVYGHSFLQDARAKHAEGLISDKILLEISRGAKADAEDVTLPSSLLEEKAPSPVEPQNEMPSVGTPSLDQLVDAVAKKILSAIVQGWAEREAGPIKGGESIPASLGPKVDFQKPTAVDETDPLSEPRLTFGGDQE